MASVILPQIRCIIEFSASFMLAVLLWGLRWWYIAFLPWVVLASVLRDAPSFYITTIWAAAFTFYSLHVKHPPFQVTMINHLGIICTLKEDFSFCPVEYKRSRYWSVAELFLLLYVWRKINTYTRKASDNVFSLYWMIQEWKSVLYPHLDEKMVSCLILVSRPTRHGMAYWGSWRYKDPGKSCENSLKEYCSIWALL